MHFRNALFSILMITYGTNGVAQQALQPQRVSSFTDLGSGIKVKAISPDGSFVVGYYSLDRQNGGGFNGLFIWSKKDGLMSLGDFGVKPYPLAISNGGVVVGDYFGSSPHSARAFRWSASSGFQDIGSSEVERLGGSTTVASSVSDDGTSIYGTYLTASGGLHFFHWTQTSGWSDIGELSPRHAMSDTYIISKTGSMAILYRNLSTSNKEDEADGHIYRWANKELSDITPSIVSQLHINGKSFFGPLTFLADGTFIGQYDVPHTGEGLPDGIFRATTDGNVIASYRTGLKGIRIDAISNDGLLIAGNYPGESGNETRGFISPVDEVATTLFAANAAWLRREAARLARDEADAAQAAEDQRMAEEQEEIAHRDRANRVNPFLAAIGAAAGGIVAARTGNASAAADIAAAGGVNRNDAYNATTSVVRQSAATTQMLQQKQNAQGLTVHMNTAPNNVAHDVSGSSPVWPVPSAQWCQSHPNSGNPNCGQPAAEDSAQNRPSSNGTANRSSCVHEFIANFGRALRNNCSVAVNVAYCSIGPKNDGMNCKATAGPVGTSYAISTINSIPAGGYASDPSGLDPQNKMPFFACANPDGKTQAVLTSYSPSKGKCVHY